MTNKPILCSAGGALPRILTLRGQKVILDSDLAAIYGVPTKVFNQAIKRNLKRFPEDFMFQLTPDEYAGLTSRLALSTAQAMRSQTVTASEKRNIRFRPYAFTEHGAVMAANLLRNDRAVQMSVFVVRAFVMMREQLLNRAELEKRLAEIEKSLMSHDAALRDLYRKIRPLLLPPPDPPRKEIGFHVKESSASYRVRSRRKSR